MQVQQATPSVQFQYATHVCSSRAQAPVYRLQHAGSSTQAPSSTQLQYAVPRYTAPMGSSVRSSSAQFHEGCRYHPGAVSGVVPGTVPLTSPLIAALISKDFKREMLLKISKNYGENYGEHYGNQPKNAWEKIRR